MLKRKKDDHEKDSRAAFNEMKREALFGKADDTSLFQQFSGSGSSSSTPRSYSNPLLEATQKEEADEKKRLALIEAKRPRKLFVCGDVRGNFEKLSLTVETQEKKVGNFDAILCVGSLLPNSSDINNIMPYLKGDKRAPRDCYFIDTGEVLLQAAPKGRILNSNLHFLGAYGVREVCGLRVAFLSGHYDPSIYDVPDVDYVGGAFTKRVIKDLQRLVRDDPGKRGVDVLLTSGWPAGICQNIEDEAQRPPEVENNPSWELACAPPLAELCLAIEPRYHIFGSANIFYQRPPFQTLKRGHTCRCIGLGQVGSASKQQKWLHALQLSSMAHMSTEDLTKPPTGIVTACPFNADASQSQAEGTGAKQGPPALADNTELLREAMTHLLSGDMDEYRILAVKLGSSPFVCASTVTPGG